MISFESRDVRHIVARLERGENIHQALETLAVEHSIRAAWISGLGAFESCSLCEYDQRSKTYRPEKRFDVPVEILNLTGNLSLSSGKPFAHLHATVSREVGETIEILGGHLREGVVFACELRLDAYDDLSLGREVDPDTGLSLWRAPIADGRPAAPASVPERDVAYDAPTQTQVQTAKAGGVSWADVARASSTPEVVVRDVTTSHEPVQPRLSLAERKRRAKAARADKTTAPRFAPEGPTRAAPPPEPLPKKHRMTESEFFDAHIPEPGDYVDHEVFGLCKVDGESGTGGLVIRMDNGVRKAIKLDFFEIEPAHAGDRRIFRLRPKRRK